jgi:hypothetical protein
LGAYFLLGAYLASGAVTVIDFESISLGEQINTQYQSAGLIFDGGRFGDPAPGSSIRGTMEATNVSSGSNISNPIGASFTFVTDMVQFLVAGDTNGSNLIEVRGFLDGSEVYANSFTTGTVMQGGSLPSTSVLVMPVSGLDRIEIRRLDGSRAFSIDDFHFGSIPEPSALISILLSFAIVILHRDRRMP